MATKWTCPKAWRSGKRNLLCDPQTSGGLLVACAPEVVADVLDLFRQQGFGYAREIGRMTAPARSVPAESGSKAAHSGETGEIRVAVR